MKMRYLFVIILLIVCMLVGICSACYDTAPRPKATPDLTAYIIKTPVDTYEKHGFSERTDIMFNLARFKKLYLDSAKQMQMLQARVKLLEDRTKTLEDTANVIVIDANGVDL